MKRIVATIAVGAPKFARCALGLGRSLRLIGDTHRRVVVSDLVDQPWTPAFDEVLPPVASPPMTLLAKLDFLERTDADQVLFIDADSLGFRRLDAVFAACEGKGLCVQGTWIQSGDWYGEVSDHLKRFGVEAMPQFNGGLIYYERTPQCQAVLERARAVAQEYASSGFPTFRGMIPDEPCVSISIARDGGAGSHVLPDELDFTNSAMGLVGKLHMDVRTGTCEYLCRRYDLRLIRPTLFHASRYIQFSIYWKQLDRLAALERFEQTHEYGSMSAAAKWQRSIEKRILRLRGKL